ncbi:MAG: DUF1549 and DUF1553 domain-containing protein [Planctomycetaceae bacterium]
MSPFLRLRAALPVVLLFSAVFAAGDEPFSQKERNHWAFRRVTRPSVPRTDLLRVRTPIDAFLLRKLHAAGITGNRDAGKRELIRRVKYDLLGLPPTPGEIDRFLTDQRPDAYERLIERFLADPRYGETWGRVWLDLVRFSETAGFNADPHRPLAYKYRDYVIRSFNDNKPYDRFVTEQIAGDELFPDEVDALIATGYNRMWPDESNASDVLLARQDALNDLTGNVGSVFLGLSMGCCQCHDHKFDPLLQSDFYRLQAFFAGIVLKDNVAIGTPRQLVAYQQRRRRWLDDTAPVRRELHDLESKAKARAAAVKRRKFPPKVLDAIDTAEEERDALQWQLSFWSERQIDLKEKQILKQLTDKQRKRRRQLQKKLAVLRKREPQPPKTAAVMATVELPSGVPKTFLLAGGSYRKPESEVQPGFLAVTLKGPRQPARITSPRQGTSGRRATLAKWLVDRSNPLTARVMVNRIWQGHFGRGLVSNANDFGTRTPPPTHPELLDWLADEFVRSGWDVKQMHRLMLTSSTYRQSGDRRAAGAGGRRPKLRGLHPAAVDPGNTLLWRYPRRRLTAERIRDGILAVAGQLNGKMYGPGVKPALPPKFSARHAWKPTKSAYERNRRSVYIYAKRNLPYPLLKAFDLPDMHESCARRAETTIAPQALFLLNSKLVLDAAESFAEQLSSRTSSDDLPGIVRAGYLRAYGRNPTVAETAAAVAFLQAQERIIKNSRGATKSKQSPRQRAVVDFCHALLNSNEFLFVE